MKVWATYFPDDDAVVLWGQKPTVKGSFGWHCPDHEAGWLSFKAFLELFGGPLPTKPRLISRSKNAQLRSVPPAGS